MADAAATVMLNSRRPAPARGFRQHPYDDIDSAAIVVKTLLVPLIRYSARWLS